MKTMAFYSIKGGVGKTATAVNTAYLAAKGSVKTLLCDLDPQGSSSYYYRIKPKDDFKRKSLLKGGKSLIEGIRGSDFEGLDILPASLSFRNLDITLESKGRLKDALASLKDEYSLVILDCPPNLTLLSENIFNASDIIAVPLVPSPLSEVAYQKLLDFFKDKGLKKSKLLPFISMFEMRKAIHSETAERLSKKEERLLKTRIPFASDVERMGLHRSPVCHTRPTCKASASYVSLWREMKNAARI